MGLRAVVCALLLLAFGWCVWCALGAAYHQASQITVVEDVAGWRAAARSIPDAGDVSLWGGCAGLDSVCRYRLISVNWEISPRVARLITAPAPNAGFVISSAYLTAQESDAFARADYRVLYSNEFAQVWFPQSLPPPTLRTVSLAETACRWGGLRPPNGLGVYAGKAKLLLRNHGIPEDFWTDPAYAVYQPSYPPGMTLLALFVFAVFGIATWGPISLVVPLALVLLFLALTHRARDPIVYLTAALYVACPLALRMGAGFYAEPWAALCLVMGLSMVRRNPRGLGWWVVGSAALFRPEALVLAGVIWCVACVRHRGEVSVWRGLGAVLPGLTWQVIVFVLGARIYDFDFGALPNVAHWVSALEFLGRLFTMEAGEIGGGILLLLGVGFWRGKRGAWIVPTLFLFVCVLLLGFNVSEDFIWMVDYTLPRTVWLALAPMMGSVCGERFQFCVGSGVFAVARKEKTNMV